MQKYKLKDLGRSTLSFHRALTFKTFQVFLAFKSHKYHTQQYQSFAIPFKLIPQMFRRFLFTFLTYMCMYVYVGV